MLQTNAVLGSYNGPVAVQDLHLSRCHAALSRVAASPLVFSLISSDPGSGTVLDRPDGNDGLLPALKNQEREILVNMVRHTELSRLCRRESWRAGRGEDLALGPIALVPWSQGDGWMGQR